MTSKDLQLEGYQLRWQKSYSRLSVVVDRVRQLIDIIVYIFLILLGVLGVTIVLFHAYILIKSGSNIWISNNWTEGGLNIWYWSLLGDMFLYYLYQENKSAKKRVVRKGDINKKHYKTNLEISQAYGKQGLKVLDKAYHVAAKDQHSAIQPLHIFAALLQDNDVKIILGRLGVRADDLYAATTNIIIKDNIITKGGQINLYEAAMTVVMQAYVLAYELRRPKVEAAELLEAVVKIDSVVKDILFNFKITEEKIFNVVAWIRIQEMLQERYDRFRNKAGFKPKGSMNRSMTAVQTPVLDNFSEDYTILARAGYFGLCVARDMEFDSIYRIMEGGSSSLLVGQPGVGVDTIIEGLANRMVAEDVPGVLKDMRLVSLDVASLVAGSMQSGELEQRVMNVIYEIERAGNVALYINNIHNLVGASSAGRANIDLADVLTEGLRKRGVVVIASTTPHDYMKHIEHSALINTFTKIEVKEPDVNQAIQILAANIGVIESKNRVFFSYDSLEQAVKLSERYMSDQYLPSKAIHLLEEVAVRVKNKRGKNQIVSSNDIALLVSEKAEVPIAQVTENESNKLMNLEKLIHLRLVNQNEAVDVVASSLRRARVELRDIKKPIANFLFLGPTGVGKTELAKTVADVYFGNEERMIRMDMSEYQEKNSIQRMIGVPGDESGGVLTNAVREDPHSILLLDEVEKAHPDILNIFLQVMDDGRLTDVTGRTVDFTNLIVIATSNACTNYVQDRTKAGATAEEIKLELMEKELRPYFRPEFLNRFDSIVVFKPLSQEHIEQIAGLMLKGEQKSLKAKGIYLEPTPEAIKELAIAGYDPKFGARPLKRVIQERVQNALADYMLTGQIDRRDKVILEAGGKLRIEKAKKL